MNSVALRAGYQFQNDIGAGYNVGLGFKFLDNYAINYVFSPYGILGNTHKAEISFSFPGKTGERKSFVPHEPVEDVSPVEVITTESRNVSYFLPAPISLKAVREGDQLVLSWDKIDVPEAKYYVYVELPVKSQIVRVTKEPIVENTYTFNPTVNQINLRFYVSFVKENWESELSKPLPMKQPESWLPPTDPLKRGFGNSFKERNQERLPISRLNPWRNLFRSDHHVECLSPTNDIALAIAGDHDHIRP